MFVKNRKIIFELSSELLLFGALEAIFLGMYKVLCFVRLFSMCRY